jgi:methylase of polypeptide subunit release factors
MPSQLVHAGPELVRWAGAGGPFEYGLCPQVFRPTLTSEAIADVLDVVQGAEVVVDVGCGGGFLAIVAARRGARRVYATDISEEAVELCRRNAERAGVGDRVIPLCGDGLEPFREIGVLADVVINDISGAPDVIARPLGWYPDDAIGGGDGISLPIRVIDGLPGVLRPERGVLVQPIGSLQFTPAIRRRIDAHFGSWRVATYRQLFLPRGWGDGDGEVDELRRQGRIRLWEARGLTWWDLEILVCEGLRRNR